MLQLNREAFLLVGTSEIVALYEKAPSTEARRNLFSVIFEAVIAPQIEVPPILPGPLLTGREHTWRCPCSLSYTLAPAPVCRTFILGVGTVHG